MYSISGTQLNRGLGAVPQLSQCVLALPISKVASLGRVVTVKSAFRKALFFYGENINKAIFSLTILLYWSWMHKHGFFSDI